MEEPVAREEPIPVPIPVNVGAIEPVAGGDDGDQWINGDKVGPCISQPYRWICHLTITNHKGETFLGTGFFVRMNGGEPIIVTSAHWLYDKKDYDGYPAKIMVHPGRTKEDKPFGGFKATREQFVVPHEWIDNSDQDHGYGIILPPPGVPRDFGFRMTSLDDPQLRGTNITTCGYPTAGPNVENRQMYLSGGIIKIFDEKCLVYESDNTGRQTGSPLWTWAGSNWVVIGIHGYNGKKANEAVRITPSIEAFLREKTGSTPEKY